MTLEASTSYINLLITEGLCKVHIHTSIQDYGTIYLIVFPSLNVFKTMLINFNLTSGVKCYNFCT